VYSLGRTLLTKSIGDDEVGKVFSVIAVGSAFMPVIGGNIFRTLYNSTIDTFPGSFWLLAAAVSVLGTYLNFAVYTKRAQFRKNI
jgi:hypothetical protein